MTVSGMNEKNQINVRITLTASKILAYLIVFFGFGYACLFKDASVLISTSTLGAGLIGYKNYTDTKIETKGESK